MTSKIFVKSKILSNMIPEENVCIDCQTPLSNTFKVSDNVCVITMQGVVTGFKMARVVNLKLVFTD